MKDTTRDTIEILLTVLIMIIILMIAAYLNHLYILAGGGKLG